MRGWPLNSNVNLSPVKMEPILASIRNLFGKALGLSIQLCLEDVAEGGCLTSYHGSGNRTLLLTSSKRV